MFTVRKNRIVKAWPISVPVAMDGGQVEEHQMKLDYELISEDDFGQLSGEGGDKAVLSRVIKGWSGIGDEQGQPLPFGEAELASAIELPNFRKAAFEGYFTCVQGSGPAKNS